MGALRLFTAASALLSAYRGPHLGRSDSYRAELVRAARKGTGFNPATDEPAAWAVRSR